MKETLAGIAMLVERRNEAKISAAERVNKEIREITQSLIELKVEGPIYHWESEPVKDEHGYEIGAVYSGLCWNGEKILYCFDPDGDPTIDWAKDGRPLLGESIDIRVSMRKSLHLLLDDIMDKLNIDILNYEGNEENEN